MHLGSVRLGGSTKVRRQPRCSDSAAPTWAPPSRAATGWHSARRPRRRPRRCGMGRGRQAAATATCAPASFPPLSRRWGASVHGRRAFILPLLSPSPSPTMVFWCHRPIAQSTAAIHAWRTQSVEGRQQDGGVSRDGDCVGRQQRRWRQRRHRRVGGSHPFHGDKEGGRAGGRRTWCSVWGGRFKF